MFVRQSTLAVAIVIAISAVAATTQVFAADELGSAPTACLAALVQTVAGNVPAQDAGSAVTRVGTER